MTVVAVDNRVAVCVARLYLYFFERRFLFDCFVEFELDVMDKVDTDKEVSSLEFVLVAV